MAVVFGILALPIQATVVQQSAGMECVEKIEQRSDNVPEQEEIIEDYWNAIGQSDWDAWVQCHAPSIREDRRRFVSNPENHAEGHGVLSIKHAQVISMEKVSDDYAPNYYRHLADYYERGDFACYLVEIYTKVEPENDYFQTGKSKHICIIVKQDDAWYMGAMYAYSDEYESALRGIRYGLIDFVTQPTTITLADKLGNIYRNVSFTEAIVNITCNEIGNMGYETAAVYANIMAIKMICWWARIGHYDEENGYDIGYGNVTYRDHLETNAERTQGICNAVAVLKPYYMVSSSGTGGKLFASDYDGYPSKGEGSGGLSQPESNKRAKNGYTWRKILHYFYDNSSYNNKNVGIVQIGHECKYAKSSSYSSNTTQHWFACTICGAKLSLKKHVWVVYTGYTKCSTCGRLKETTSNAIHESQEYLLMD